MGLINEVNNISQEIKTQNTEKEQKRIEKIKKEYQEKEKKRIETQTKDFIRTEFQQYFEQYGSSYEINFLSIDRKNKILEECKKDILHVYNDTKFPLKTYYKDTEAKILIETFNKNYYKILKEQKTIYLSNEKYIIQKAAEEAAQIETKQKIDIWNILEKIIKILIKIIIGIFAGLVFLLGCACKSVK